jgi:hypothetical protein
MMVASRLPPSNERRINNVCIQLPPKVEYPAMNLQQLQRRALGILAALALSASLASAQVVLYPGQPAEGAYRVVSGQWIESSTRGAAVGADAPPGVLLLPEGNRLVGTIEFRPAITRGAEYQIELAWPAEANATGVTVEVELPVGRDRKTINFDGTQSARWTPVTIAALPANATLTVRVIADTATGPVDPAKPYLLALDALALRVRETVQPSAGTDTGFNPFAPADAAAMDDPFAQPGIPAIPDPFASPTEDPFAASQRVTPRADNPFAQPSIGTPDDPFAAPPAAGTATTTNPFAEPDAISTTYSAAAADPFADPFASQQSNPFSAPANPTTFGMATADPFAAPDPFVAPTTASTGAPADPFAAPADPFVSSPTTTAAPAVVPPPATAAVSGRLLEFAPLEEVPLVDLAFSTDIDSAVKKARQQQRPLLLLFSGDSQQAQAFERTLRHPEVAKVLEDFELVRVDYRSNRRVAREYAVMSFPYIVVKNRHGFTEGHVLPSNNRDALRSTLISYTQQLF